MHCTEAKPIRLIVFSESAIIVDEGVLFCSSRPISSMTIQKVDHFCCNARIRNCTVTNRCFFGPTRASLHRWLLSVHKHGRKSQWIRVVLSAVRCVSASHLCYGRVQSDGGPVRLGRRSTNETTQTSEHCTSVARGGPKKKRRSSPQRDTGASMCEVSEQVQQQVVDFFWVCQSFRLCCLCGMEAWPPKCERMPVTFTFSMTGRRWTDISCELYDVHVCRCWVFCLTGFGTAKKQETNNHTEATILTV